MDRYDVKAEDCHNPLTSQEIAERIQAGRFQRNEPCRKVGENEWRTIDELFPLPEHGSGNRVEPSSDKPEQRPTAFPLGIAAALATAFLAGGIHFLWLRPAHRAAAIADLERHNTVLPGAPNSGYSYSPTTPRNPGSESLRNNQKRLETERRQRGQLARDQARRADRTRGKAEEQARVTHKAAGTDYHVPFDEDYDLRDPLMNARVRVHDNDVTTFDIWINGAHYRNVQKLKGFIHSGTDETVIYSDGRASLYYVWAISGQLNRCILRVREN